MGTYDLYSPELPEPIIHRIQSLLPRKKSAETTLISRSWRAAWSTRPAIDLDKSRFPSNPSSFWHISSLNYGDIDGLVKYATKTFKRYEESNLKINTFRLWVNKDWYGYSGLATKWTLKALKLGATDFAFRLHPGTTFPLPELFASENVVRLCLKHAFIDLATVARCQGLKSLTLSHVKISTHSLFGILSCCPLIETLSLSHTDSCNIYRQSVDDVVNDEHEQHGFKKLTSLVMCHLGCEIQNELLGDLSSKFPNLKELTLKLDEEIQVISSRSLEMLNYSHGSDQMQRFELDVPRIRKFTFQGENMPNLWFRSTMDQWESHVSLTLTCDDIDEDGISNKWFFELSKFLTRLRMSKIYLCLHLLKRDSMYNQENNEYQEGEIEGLYAREVEDLTINNKSLPSMGFKVLLDGLFRICRPKMISQYVSPRDDNDDEMSEDNMWNEDDHYGGWNTREKDIGGCNTRENDMFLCKALEQVKRVTSLLLPTNFRHGLIDLEEVIAQKLIDEVWKPQPVGSILDDSTSEQRRFRFLLKWKPSLNQYNSDDEYDDDHEDSNILRCIKIIFK